MWRGFDFEVSLEECFIFNSLQNNVVIVIYFEKSVKRSVLQTFRVTIHDSFIDKYAFFRYYIHSLGRKLFFIAYVFIHNCLGPIVYRLGH